VTRFVCRIEQRYAGGDHLILLGAVEQFETSDADPLVYLRGGYRQVLSSGAG
jgi:3-hydroxy-9,10-secoandrosta-1,3,5(10)-triene-9,17-dione monooxygenase reductase component